MEIKEAYRVMQAECGIGVGDKVKVVRRFNRDEYGYDSCSWDNVDYKREMQGGIYRVGYITRRYIRLDVQNGGTPCFPFFALELVEKYKKPEPEKMIMVKGKPVSEATVELAVAAYLK